VFSSGYSEQLPGLEGRDDPSARHKRNKAERAAHEERLAHFSEFLKEAQSLSKEVRTSHSRSENVDNGGIHNYDMSVITNIHEQVSVLIPGAVAVAAVNGVFKYLIASLKYGGFIVKTRKKSIIVYDVEKFNEAVAAIRALEEDQSVDVPLRNESLRVETASKGKTAKKKVKKP